MELIFCEAVLAVVLMLASRHCHGLNTSTGPTEVCLKVPFSVDDCYAAALKHPISPKSAKIDCLQRLMWYYEPDQNLTIQDQSYFSSLSRTGFTNGVPKPKTGFRVRKEYRVLTDVERQRLHNAFIKLYEKGILKKYADLHRQAIDTAHDGAAFLAWHRVLLAMFEDELRLEDNTVSLPYWDTTLDDNMDNGVNSIIWSSKFLGNGNGDVTTGPFAGWKTARGNLYRDYGNSPRGKLTTEKNIKNILTRCNTDDIVFPLTDPTDVSLREYVIEYPHNGVHNWVGGDMSDAFFAAYDPVFYMVHAFVDLQWELFRIRQINVCGVNPETDYAVQTGDPGHGPNDPMYGFDGFKNIDGLKNYWTELWYNYEKRPQCPDCGSKYLYCDVIKNKCVSHSRRTDFNAGQYLQNSWAGTFGLSAEPFEPRTILIPKRIFREFLPSPFSDGRTRESAKYDAKKAVAPKQPVASAFEIQQPVRRHQTGNHVPFVLDTVAQNLDPFSNNNNQNNFPSTLNININKHSLPALLMQKPVAKTTGKKSGAAKSKPQKKQKTAPNKTAGKSGNKNRKVINLSDRLNQHTQNNRNQNNRNQNNGSNNNKKPTKMRRRKYLSLA